MLSARPFPGAGQTPAKKGPGKTTGRLHSRPERIPPTRRRGKLKGICRPHYNYSTRRPALQPLQPFRPPFLPRPHPDDRISRWGCRSSVLHQSYLVRAILPAPKRKITALVRRRTLARRSGRQGSLTHFVLRNYNAQQTVTSTIGMSGKPPRGCGIAWSPT